MLHFLEKIRQNIFLSLKICGRMLEYGCRRFWPAVALSEIRLNLNQKNSVDEFFRGKGKWQKENKKIRFFPDLSNEKNEIDLSGATARFDSKNKKELVFFNLISSWNLNVGMQKID